MMMAQMNWKFHAERQEDVFAFKPNTQNLENIKSKLQIDYNSTFSSFNLIENLDVNSQASHT